MAHRFTPRDEGSNLGVYPILSRAHMSRINRSVDPTAGNDLHKRLDDASFCDRLEPRRADEPRSDGRLHSGPVRAAAGSQPALPYANSKASAPVSTRSIIAAGSSGGNWYTLPNENDAT